MSAPPRVARPFFAGRRILLGVTGGIAAYKTIGMARDLALSGAAVDVVLTASALEFVRPLSYEAITGRPALSELYAPGDPLLHIRLARESELVLVAPATANFIARAAVGMADDLLTASLLATRAPVVVCPAMNDRMFAHPQTQANLARLEEIGYAVAGPAEGPLAWGEGEGKGRMLEPDEILDHAERALRGSGSLSGRRVLITAGPTREPIDPVRFIGNHSSGRMGYALAAAAWKLGAEVTLVSGPVHLSAPTGVERVDVETAEEMRAAVEARLGDADVLVMSAAVADFRPARVAKEKIKKEGGGAPASIEMERTADVLRETRAQRREGSVIVGFALETRDAVENGARKLKEKSLDLLVVNDAREPGAGFEVETNRVTILDREGGREDLPLLGKAAVAEQILERVSARLAGRAS